MGQSATITRTYSRTVGPRRVKLLLDGFRWINDLILPSKSVQWLPYRLNRRPLGHPQVASVMHARPFGHRASQSTTSKILALSYVPRALAPILHFIYPPPLNLHVIPNLLDLWVKLVQRL